MMTFDFKNKAEGSLQKIAYGENDSVLTALKKQGILLDSPCNGMGTCGKCKVWIAGELKLACQLKPDSHMLVESQALSSPFHGLKKQTQYFSPESSTAFAIDIGTTGIEYAWICLKTGQECMRASSLNEQTEYGADVFSRMAYALKSPSHLYELKSCIQSQLEREMLEITGETYAPTIEKVVISANTVMCHLLLGLDIAPLSKFPYQPKDLTFDQRQIAWQKLKDIQTHIMPCASAFIGGDVVGGLTQVPMESNENALFIDMGTNGEIVLLKENELYATSTAAGPALEGMNISCGIRAIPGAIYQWDLKKARPVYKTIGEEKPLGICGSGLLHAISALLKNQMILPSGRYTQEVGKSFALTSEIQLTQKDIRQVQLAKGAVLSGIELLLKAHELNIEDIKKLYVAGQLGYHLSEETLKNVGFIPQDFKGEMFFLGNTSLEGAKAFLRDAESSKALRKMALSIETLDLSTLKDFQDHFVASLHFPLPQSSLDIKEV